jgi:thymidylate synthase (FAD)
MYTNLVKVGVPAEDARFVLPNATETKIIVTMNFRSLLHFFEERCCSRAQWEIRAMAYEMLKIALEVCPVVFENAGPICINGICKQGKKSCGRGI